VQNPVIPGDALETERTVALADLALLRDDMYRYPMRLLTQAAFAGHPYGVPASGTEETLPRLAAEHVRDWHRQRVLAGAAVVGIVGDLEPDELAGLAARELAALVPGAPVPLAAPAWPAAAVQRVEVRGKAQTALALGFPGPARGDDDRYVAHLVAGVASGLGGRFFDELRDKQSLAYTVHAFAGERRLAGTFVAYIATSPEREEVARAGLLGEFAKLRERAVTAEELARAQTYAIGTHAIRQESGGAVLGDMVDAWLFGRSLAELEEFDARVRAVTPEAIRALAERYFDERRRVEGVVRGTGRNV
jgi:zinc protease